MVTGTKHVVIVQGHPDPQHRHFCHALADAYAAGARGAGHEVVTVDVARLDFPLARSREDLASGPTPEAIRQVQEALTRPKSASTRSQPSSSTSACVRSSVNWATRTRTKDKPCSARRHYVRFSRTTMVARAFTRDCFKELRNGRRDAIFKPRSTDPAPRLVAAGGGLHRVETHHELQNFTRRLPKRGS